MPFELGDVDSMPLFPDVIGDSYTLTPQFAGTRSPFGQNSWQSYRKAARERLTWDLGWPLMLESDAINFEEHVLAAIGASSFFLFYDWMPEWLWHFVSLGVGTGSSQVLTIPGKETASHEFYHGDYNAIASFTIAVGTGAHGEDKVTLTAPDGALVWCTFNGRRRFVAGFETDDQPMRYHLEPDGYCNLTTRLVGGK